RADGRAFNARAAEIVDDIVLPVLERRAFKAEARAAEIAAAREIRARRNLALRVIGAVVLHKRAQRQREIAVGESRAAVLDRELRAPGLLVLDVTILVGGAALQVLHLRVQVLDVLFELLDLRVVRALRRGSARWRALR